MKSKFSPGDVVVCIKAYPTSDTDTYTVGSTFTLISCLYPTDGDVPEYWLTDHGLAGGMGIFDSHFRKATKLDKALK